MSPKPDDPSDISQRVITPEALWLIVIGGSAGLIVLGLVLSIALLVQRHC